MTKHIVNGNESIPLTEEQKNIRARLAKDAVYQIDIGRHYRSKPLEEVPYFLDGTLAKLKEQQLDLYNLIAMDNSDINEVLKGFTYAERFIAILIDRCEAEYLKNPCHTDGFKVLNDRCSAINRADSETCKRSLFHAIASCSNPKIIEGFDMAQLKEIDSQFNDSHLTGLIAKEVLKRADKNILFFEVAIQLFKKAKSLVSMHKDITMFESTKDTKANFASISEEVGQFVAKRTDTSLKRQLLRQKIEEALLNSSSNKPLLDLGWSGSRYTIKLKEEKIFEISYEVSYGLHAIYKAACSDKVSDFDLNRVINKATSPVGCVSAFFRALTGRSRSAETQTMYNELAEISNFESPKMND